MTNEHEQRLLQVLDYYKGRMRDLEREDEFDEILYDLIADIEQHARESQS